MKKYFKVARVEDEAKQDAIIMYLTYNAVLGSKHDEIERGLYTINTWDDFKRELNLFLMGDSSILFVTH